MIPFSSGDWVSSLIVWAIFSVIVILPCIAVAIFGVKMINQLGLYPSRTPLIQTKIFFPLIVIEGITFLLFFAFYQVFRGV